MTAAVEFDGVGFVYPDGTRALADVSLAVPAGQRLAIIGQNGSGKSTLVRQLNGLLQPTEGRVLIEGRATKGRHVAELVPRLGRRLPVARRGSASARCWPRAAAGARRAFATPSGSIRATGAPQCVHALWSVRSTGAPHCEQATWRTVERSLASSAGDGERMKFFSRRKWWKVMSWP